jgi:hypothetical protein
MPATIMRKTYTHFHHLIKLNDIHLRPVTVIAKTQTQTQTRTHFRQVKLHSVIP